MIILLLHLNSQNKNTSVFVFFRIFTLPVISSPIFDAPINFRSKDIVTHGAFSADLCAAVSKSSNGVVAAVAARNEARSAAFAKEHGVERSYASYEELLSDDEVDAFSRLMDLTDNDLMDLLLARKEPEAAVDLPQVHALLKKLRTA